MPSDNAPTQHLSYPVHVTTFGVSLLITQPLRSLTWFTASGHSLTLALFPQAFLLLTGPELLTHRLPAQSPLTVSSLIAFSVLETAVSVAADSKNLFNALNRSNQGGSIYRSSVLIPHSLRNLPTILMFSSRSVIHDFYQSRTLEYAGFLIVLSVPTLAGAASTPPHGYFTRSLLDPKFNDTSFFNRCETGPSGLSRFLQRRDFFCNYLASTSCGIVFFNA